jgi:hypothetical protein
VDLVAVGGRVVGGDTERTNAGAGLRDLDVAAGRRGAGGVQQGAGLQVTGDGDEPAAGDRAVARPVRWSASS